MPQILTFPQNSFSHITSIWWAWAKRNCSWNLGFQIVVSCEGLVAGGGREPFLQEFLDVVKYAYVLRYNIYIYTLVEHVSIYFSEISSMCCYGSWYHNPYKSMKQFAAVKTNRHLPNAEANGKQGEPFFSGYAVHDVCPYQKLFAREHLDKNCRFLGFSQASTEIRKCLTRESLQKPLYYIHGFSKPMFKSVWVCNQERKSSTTAMAPKLGACSVFEFKSFILRIQKSNLLPYHRVASEPSWSGLWWPAGTDCTSTFSNSSKHTPCVNMDISIYHLYGCILCR